MVLKWHLQMKIKTLSSIDGQLQFNFKIKIIVFFKGCVPILNIFFYPFPFYMQFLRTGFVSLPHFSIKCIYTTKESRWYRALTMVIYEKYTFEKGSTVPLSDRCISYFGVHC